MLLQLIQCHNHAEYRSCVPAVSNQAAQLISMCMKEMYTAEARHLQWHITPAMILYAFFCFLCMLLSHIYFNIDIPLCSDFPFGRKMKFLHYFTFSMHVICCTHISFLQNKLLHRVNHCNMAITSG